MTNNTPRKKRSTAREKAQFDEIASIETDDSIYLATILDYSPLGVGVNISVDPSQKPLEKNQTVTTVLRRGEQKIHLLSQIASVEETDVEGKATLRIGIKFLNEHKKIRQLRSGQRFFFDGSLQFQGQIKGADFEGVTATIKDFSRTGILLSTSSDVKRFLPQMKLSLTLNFPNHEDVVEDLTIRHIHAEDEGYLLGCSFDSLKERSMNLLLNYYISHNDAAIVPEDFAPDIIEPSDLKIEVANQPREILKIAELRYSELTRDQADSDLSSAWQTIDEFDKNSIHITVKLGTRLLACARLFVHQKFSKKGADFGHAELNRVSFDSDFAQEAVINEFWRAVFKVYLTTRSPYLLWLGGSTVLHPKHTREIGFLSTIEKDEEFLILAMDDLIHQTRASFKQWSNLVAPTLRETADPNLEMKLSLKLAVAKVFEKMASRGHESYSQYIDLRLVKEVEKDPEAKIARIA